MERRRLALVLVALTALGAAVRIVFYFSFGNTLSWESEAYSKINLVYTWIAQGGGYPDTNFGPLHTWLIYLIAWPFENRVVPVRVFSLICGAAAIPVFYLVSRRQLPDRAALVAAALFAAYPLHVRASATSLAESPYVLFFLLGLWAFLVHQQDEDRSFAWLAFSALALTGGAMLRFESWLFYPVFCLLALRRSIPRAIGYGALLALFPLIHMFICWQVSGDPVSFGKTSARTFALYLPQMPLSYRATGWFVAFWQILGPAMTVLTPLGFLWAAGKRKAGTLFALFVFPYLFMSVRTLRGQMDPQLLRYGIILGCLMIPFAAAALAEAGRRVFREARGAAVFLAVATALLATGQIAWAWNQSVDNALPEDVRATAEFLHDHVPRTDKVLMDKRFHPFLVIESGGDPARAVSLDYVGEPITDRARYEELVHRFFPLAYRHGEEIEWGRDIKLYDRDAYLEMMQRERPAWLVLDYESAGNIQAFPIAPEATTATVDGRRLTRVFARGNFRVFRIEDETDAEAAP